MVKRWVDEPTTRPRLVCLPARGEATAEREVELETHGDGAGVARAVEAGGAARPGPHLQPHSDIVQVLAAVSPPGRHFGAGRGDQGSNSRHSCRFGSSLGPAQLSRK